MTAAADPSTGRYIGSRSPDAGRFAAVSRFELIPLTGRGGCSIGGRGLGWRANGRSGAAGRPSASERVTLCALHAPRLTGRRGIVQNALFNPRLGQRGIPFALRNPCAA